MVALAVLVVFVAVVLDAVVEGPLSLFRYACRRANRARASQPSEEPDCPLGEGRP